MDIVFARLLLYYLVWDILQELVYGKREPFVNLKDLQSGIGDMSWCRHQTVRIRKAVLWWKRCLAAMAKQNKGAIQRIFCWSVIIIIIINDIYMAQVRRKEMQQIRQVNCYRLSVASVMKNVFSRLRNTDSDMFNRNAAGRLFHVTGPLTAKLWSP